MKKYCFYSIIFMFFVVFIFSCKNNQYNENKFIENKKTFDIIDEENIDITGIYLDRSKTYGILIETIADGNYKFTRIDIRNNEILKSELQTAYVVKRQGWPQQYLYYWHTGRYNDEPGSDAIIVYEIEIIKNYDIHGIYSFPEGTPEKDNRNTVYYTKQQEIKND